MTFTPDGRHIISGSEDKTIKIWNSNTGNLLHSLAGHARGVNAVVISQDGEQIISGSEDKTIKLWKLASGESETLFQSDSLSNVSPLIVTCLSVGMLKGVSGFLSGCIDLFFDLVSRFISLKQNRIRGVAYCNGFP